MEHRSSQLSRAHTCARISPAPIAWPRAIAFGLVTAGVDVVGHGATIDAGGDVWVLLFGAAVAMVLARSVAARRLRPAAMVGALAAIQTAMHIACETFVTPHPGVEHAAADTFTSHMALVHGVSIIVGAVILLALEAFAWREMGRAARGVIRRWKRLVRRGERSLTDAVAATRFTAWTMHRVRGSQPNLVSAFGVRGPPASRA